MTKAALEKQVSEKLLTKINKKDFKDHINVKFELSHMEVHFVESTINFVVTYIPPEDSPLYIKLSYYDLTSNSTRELEMSSKLRNKLNKICEEAFYNSELVQEKQEISALKFLNEVLK